MHEIVLLGVPRLGRIAIAYPRTWTLAPLQELDDPLVRRWCMIGYTFATRLTIVFSNTRSALPARLRDEGASVRLVSRLA